ncbi:MAG: helicase-related protein, partial [Bacteroidales bacterium]
GLRHILLDKLNIAKSRRKVVIFTEWKKMINIIARTLRLSKIGFVEITGDTPVKQRRKLISIFEEDESCKIFLATETGGSGLNLQVADTVINFEVPYSALQKNQRLGRIDRIGQRSENLTIINLIAEDSLEEKMAAGLEPENTLTDSLLNPDSEDKVLELTDRDRKDFLTALQETINDMGREKPAEKIIDKPAGGQMLIDFTDEDQEMIELRTSTESKKTVRQPDQQEEIMEGQRIDKQEIDQVLSSGVDFLSNLFKITTGKHINIRKDNLEYDPDTGEITLKFKVTGQ